MVARHAGARALYFTLPAVRPPAMYFCEKRNSTMTGSAASIAPAEKMPQFCDWNPDTSWKRPIARVCGSGR